MLRRTTIALLLLASAVSSGGARGAEPEPERAAKSFRFRSDTPALGLVPRPDGFVEVQLEDHRAGEAPPGAPDLPVRTVLVAIPPGATPRLEFRTVGEPERRAGAPRPVPRVAAESSSRPLGQTPEERLLAAAEHEPRLRYEADSRIYDAARVYPDRAAWLGKIGVLRHQRYVAVHLSPVRYDARARSLVVAPAIELTVHFDGAEQRVQSGPEDATFEAVYRRSFVNYEQGRSFRLEREEPPAVEAAVAGSVPRRRIVVREDGIIRLDQAFFLARAPEFLAYSPSRWKLTSRGVQVPLHLRQNPGDANVLEPGESISFYGQRLDEEPETVLIADNGGNEDLYEMRDFSDDNVYFLTVEPGTQPQMATRNAAPAAGTPPTFYTATAHAETDDLFLPLGGHDPWFWEPAVIEVDPLRTDTIALPGLQSGTAPAQFRVRVRGASACNAVNPDHRTRVSVKNSSNQTLKLPASDPNNDGNENVGVFDGRTYFLHNFGWVHTALQPQVSNPLQVSLEVEDIVGCANDVLLDWIEIDYRHSFAAIGDVLSFDYPNGTADFAVTGLTGPASNVWVYEVTKQIGTSGVVDAVRLTSVSVTLDVTTYTARFRMDLDSGLGVGVPRRFVVIGATGFDVPAVADFRVDRVSRLKQVNSHADLIVLSHPDLLDSVCSIGGNPCDYDEDCTAGESDRCDLDPTSELATFVAHRQSRGITTRVARIGDVEDDFNEGLAGPLAIRNFVDWVLAGGWSGSPPSYLLLLGDGSFDYKGGPAAFNYVPTSMILKDNDVLAFFSSDNLLGAVDGPDSLPELAIGRIAADSLAAAEVVLEKIRLYEQTATGDWRGHAVFLSDRGKDFDAYEALQYELLNGESRAWVEDAASYTTETRRYWTDYCVPSVWTCKVGHNVCDEDSDCAGANNECQPNCDTEGMRQAIQDAVNGVSGPGAALVQYYGHGNFILWSDDVLFCADASSPFCTEGDDIQTLSNAPAFPWLIAHNCLTGGFHHTNPVSIGEKWLERETGGAIAVLAPSGLGFRFLGENVSDQLWPDLFGPSKQRKIAVPLLDSLVELCSTAGTPEGCQFYTLLGDPSLTLALPQVAPPTQLAAAPGNHVVHLSWTASPDATGYDVYRARALNNGYDRINGNTPITGTIYDDLTVDNGTTYYYYVVARDADGFESPWSNTNTDCATLGEDCVTARPLNPFPPAVPTGVVVTDPETGGRLDVTWSNNVEVDFDFYTVHWGTTPALGQSSTSLDNTVAITGLTDSVTYYVAVSATNTSDKTSAPSAPPVPAIPTKVLGLKAPGFIGDLRIGKSGDDAALIWTPVTTDIYGKAKTVTSYDVFRSTAKDFVPDVATFSNRIGTSAGATYADDGALSSPQSMFYLVRGVDAEGTGGGLGHQLPAGISDLRLVREAGPNLHLTWSAVTEDFNHGPTQISHYVLYASPAPFSRAAIRDGLVPVLAGSIPGTEVVVPQPSGPQYYSVLAVDGRGNTSPY